MSQLQLRHHWVDISGAGDPALDYTFANVELLVDNSSILSVLDKKARAVGTQLLVPLYPLAEWAVAHWWALMEEPLTIGRTDWQEYSTRHSLRAAGEGFAFPDVRIMPEGAMFRIEWTPLTTKFQNVDFLGYGQVHIERPVVQQFFVDLIQAVLSRLEYCGLPDTWLSTEWRSLQKQSAEEAQFCRVAGKLGLDPLDVDDQSADALIDTWSALPEPIRDSTFEAADLPHLPAVVKWINDGFQLIRDAVATEDLWDAIRTRARVGSSKRLPWKEGHRLAVEARRLLNIEDSQPPPVQELPLPVVVDAEKPPLRSLDALLALNSSGVRCCYTAKHRPESRRFVQARVLMDLIFGNQREAALLTSAVTARQQMSRAFAAEFLAPAAALRNWLGGRSELTEEEVLDLAEFFGVSTYVIEHQISNHALANLVAS